MKKFINGVISVVYGLSVFAGAAAFVPQRVLAHEGEDHSVSEADKKDSNKKSVAKYKYVAQAGDSYSLIARKAVQTYGIKNKIKLSQAKTLAAETWLTQEAGSPFLNLSQSVEIAESKLKTNVDKAQKLSATDEAAWAVYVAGVNFNTDAVGQAK